MLENYVRHIDYNSAKALSLTIKAVLSDHIQFIREVNRILIKHSNGECIKLKEKYSNLHHHHEIGSWFSSLKGTTVEQSKEFLDFDNLRNDLYEMAETISASYRETEKINVDYYEKFLIKNDLFFEYLWKLADEAISSQYQFDHLTQLLNRQAFQTILEHELSRVKRESSSCCLILIDLDDFKQVNDEYGHIVGDDVLRQFSQITKEYIRTSDYAARYGGEEFLLCLPNTKLRLAVGVVSRIREAIELLSFKSLPNLKVTISAGVSLLNDDIKGSIERADKAMYSAKSKGKNRVVTYRE